MDLRKLLYGVPFKNLSRNWKIAVVFILAKLVFTYFSPSIASDELTGWALAWVIGSSFFSFFFLVHLIAQRGQRVGFGYKSTFVWATLFIYLTAFVVFIVKRPTARQ